jgi:cation transport regulator ChaC
MVFLSRFGSPKGYHASLLIYTQISILPSRLKKRIPSAKPIGYARIDDWRVVFSKKGKDGSGKANLLSTPGGVTWGVLYEIDREDLNKLDKYESGYTRTTVQVQMTNTRALTAETYISRDLTDDLVAFDSYKQYVVLGAVEHHLPADYIQYLKKLPSKPDAAGE